MNRLSSLLAVLLTILIISSGNIPASACADGSSGPAGNCTTNDISLDYCEDKEETAEAIEDGICKEESSDGSAMDEGEDICSEKQTSEEQIDDSAEDDCAEEIPCESADAQEDCEDGEAEEEGCNDEIPCEPADSEDACQDNDPADDESTCPDDSNVCPGNDSEDTDESDEGGICPNNDSEDAQNYEDGSEKDESRQADPDSKSASRIDGILICPDADMSIIRVELDSPAVVSIYDEAGCFLGKSSTLYPGEDNQWAVPIEMSFYTVILEDGEGHILDYALASQKIWPFRNYSPWGVFYLDVERISSDAFRTKYAGIFGVACRIPQDYSDPEVVVAVNNDGKMTAFRHKVRPDEIFTWKKVGQIYTGDTVCIIGLDKGEIKKVDVREVGFEWGVVLDTVPIDEESIQNIMSSAVRVD